MWERIILKPLPSSRLRVAIGVIKYHWFDWKNHGRKLSRVECTFNIDILITRKTTNGSIFGIN